MDSNKDIAFKKQIASDSFKSNRILALCAAALKEVKARPLRGIPLEY
jgi:hypothetical protein